MGQNDYHVVKGADGRWRVKRAGGTRATSVHDTQREADARARELSQRRASERVTHAGSGRIRSKDSYGKDSRRRRDKEH